MFYEHGRHLRKLSLAFPWASRIEDISPVYLPLPAPSPLLGLSNEAVAACPSLEDLSLQDSSFVLEDMGSMPHLERLCLDLRVLPDSSAARLQERLPRLWFLHFYTHADRPEPNKDLVAQLCEQGIDAYHQPGTRPHFRLQLNFNEGLPDPIV